MSKGYDDHYYDVVNFYTEQIQGLHTKLDTFKMDYLIKLYRALERPENIVQEWILKVWSMCQSGGRGYLFQIQRIDQSQMIPSMIKEAIANVCYVGCSCHIWPCHWNVKSDNYALFKETIRPEITKALQALGLKISLSDNDIFHTWND